MSVKFTSPSSVTVTGTTYENEPIIKSDGAGEVMQWQPSDGGADGVYMVEGGSAGDPLRLGIGVAAPTAELDVSGSIKASGLSRSLAKSDTVGTPTFYLSSSMLREGADASFNIDTWDGAAFQNRLKIVGATGLCSFSNGIAFSGQTDATGTGAAATSTTLDHYEEGTWTPTWVGATVAGNHTYTTQLGFYERIGRLVNFRFRLTLSAKGTISGDLDIGGLPFNPSGTASSYSSVQVGNAVNFTVNAGESLTGLTALNADTIAVNIWDSIGGSTAATDSILTNTSQVMCSGSYMV